MSESIEKIRRQLKEKQLHRIREMECGRALDALVAEYVFGYHVIEMGDGDEQDFVYRKNASIKGKIGSDELERVPNYSTVIYSAMQILNAFQYWKLEQRTEGVTALLSNQEGIASHAALHPGMAYAALPEAVCKSALVARVEENRLIEPLLEDD
ncbi:hypothetical protein [Marinicrinis lubricantis]|uniref:Uncharacterized protein n=1 Tax=Marinicrinis lubricantis TaxID=2086470 RepID=A0ABW1ILH9_9BACL